MWKSLKRCLAGACLVGLVSACSLFGVVAPQSPSQSLAYAYGTVATVRQSAASALQAGTINVATAQAILQYTDTARTGLDTAETLLISAPASGTQPNITTYLKAATTALTAAQKLLPQPASASVAASAVVAK